MSATIEKPSTENEVQPLIKDGVFKLQIEDVRSLTSENSMEEDECSSFKETEPVDQRPKVSSHPYADIVESDPKLVCGITKSVNLSVHKEDIEVEQFWCNFCKFKCIDATIFEEHVATHIFMCKFCNYFAFTRLDVLQHNLYQHNNKDVAKHNFCRLDKLEEKEEAHCSAEISKSEEKNIVGKDGSGKEVKQISGVVEGSIGDEVSDVMENTDTKPEDEGLNRCLWCGLSCQSPSLLLNHIDTIHPSEKPVLLECPFCKLTTMNYNTLNTHILLSHKKNIDGGLYSCLVCKKYGSSSKAHLHRLRCKSSKPSIYKCMLCPFKSKLSEEYPYRVQAHSVKSHGIKSVLVETLASAERLKQRVLKCKWCPFVASELDALYGHVTALHSSGMCPLTKCILCSFSCYDVNAMNIHIMHIHEEAIKGAEFSCISCNPETGNPMTISEMEAHDHHVNEARKSVIYKCILCDFASVRNERLPYRVLTHSIKEHNYKRIIFKQTSNSKYDGLIQKLENCDNSRFKEVMKSKSEEQIALNCNICTESFSTEENYINHVTLKHKPDVYVTTDKLSVDTCIKMDEHVATMEKREENTNSRPNDNEINSSDVHQSSDLKPATTELTISFMSDLNTYGAKCSEQSPIEGLKLKTGIQSKGSELLLRAPVDKLGSTIQANTSSYDSLLNIKSVAPTTPSTQIKAEHTVTQDIKAKPATGPDLSSSRESSVTWKCPYCPNEFFSDHLMTAYHVKLYHPGKNISAKKVIKYIPTNEKETMAEKSKTPNQQSMLKGALGTNPLVSMLLQNSSASVNSGKEQNKVAITVLPSTAFVPEPKHNITTECPVCSLSVKSEDMDKHLQIHSKKSLFDIAFRCGVCEVAALQRKKLEEHVSINHNNNKLSTSTPNIIFFYRCKICSLIKHQETEMALHIQNEHQLQWRNAVLPSNVQKTQSDSEGVNKQYSAVVKVGSFDDTHSNISPFVKQNKMADVTNTIPKSKVGSSVGQSSLGRKDANMAMSNKELKSILHRDTKPPMYVLTPKGLKRLDKINDTLEPENNVVSDTNEKEDDSEVVIPVQPSLIVTPDDDAKSSTPAESNSEDENPGSESFPSEDGNDDDDEEYDPNPRRKKTKKKGGRKKKLDNRTTEGLKKRIKKDIPYTVTLCKKAKKVLTSYKHFGLKQMDPESLLVCGHCGFETRAESGQEHKDMMLNHLLNCSKHEKNVGIAVDIRRHISKQACKYFFCLVCKQPFIRFILYDQHLEKYGCGTQSSKITRNKGNQRLGNVVICEKASNAMISYSNWPEKIQDCILICSHCGMQISSLDRETSQSKMRNHLKECCMLKTTMGVAVDIKEHLNKHAYKVFFCLKKSCQGVFLNKLSFEMHEEDVCGTPLPRILSSNYCDSSNIDDIVPPAKKIKKEAYYDAPPDISKSFYPTEGALDNDLTGNSMPSLIQGSTEFEPVNVKTEPAEDSETYPESEGHETPPNLEYNTPMQTKSQYAKISSKRKRKRKISYKDTQYRASNGMWFGGLGYHCSQCKAKGQLLPDMKQHIIWNHPGLIQPWFCRDNYLRSQRKCSKIYLCHKDNCSFFTIISSEIDQHIDQHSSDDLSLVAPELEANHSDGELTDPQNIQNIKLEPLDTEYEATCDEHENSDFIPSHTIKQEYIDSGNGSNVEDTQDDLALTVEDAVDSPSDATPRDDKMYYCSYCQFRTSTLSHIRSHVDGEHDSIEGGYTEMSSSVNADGNVVVSVTGSNGSSKDDEESDANVSKPSSPMGNISADQNDANLDDDKNSDIDVQPVQLSGSNGSSKDDEESDANVSKPSSPMGNISTDQNDANLDDDKNSDIDVQPVQLSGSNGSSKDDEESDANVSKPSSPMGSISTDQNDANLDDDKNSDNGVQPDSDTINDTVHDPHESNHINTVSSTSKLTDSHKDANNDPLHIKEPVSDTCEYNAKKETVDKACTDVVSSNSDVPNSTGEKEESDSEL